MRIDDLLDEIPELVDLAGRMTAAGHEIALVGGSVRDAVLLGRHVDLDLATSARPAETLAVLEGWADAVWEIGIDFGTVGARRGEHHFEITTYRSDAYDRTTRKPEVTYGDSLLEDLRRRDFTINAMAVTLPDRTFVDPFDGLADLAAHTLRTPATPEESFADDPLRMMRAARFVAQLGVSVSPEVLAAMTAMADRITMVSAERVRDELSKLMLTEVPRHGPRADGGHRAGGPRAPRAPGPAPGDRRAPPPQGRVRALPDRPGPGHRPRVLARARPPHRTWCFDWPPCCTTSASRAPGASSTAGA